MASPTTALLFCLIAGVLALSATARPCKTIFFITSSSSFNNHPLPNPNSPFRNPTNPNPNPNPPRFSFFITQIHQSHRPIFPKDDAASSKPYYSYPSSSIRDRTMDIMSIVGALLFGAGCGALTAATMYLIWSLCSNRRLDFASDSDEDEYYDVEDDDGVTAKKNGYAAVSTAVKDVPPSADEVDAMK